MFSVYWRNDGGRGWIGDVKNMLLDVTKLKAKGWKPKYNSRKAIRQTVKAIVKDFPEVSQ